MKNSPKNFDELLNLSSPKLVKLFNPIYDFLTKPNGCSEVIKDDYASFSLANGIVAAIFPNKNFIDILLALPYDKSDKALFNAVDMDYKWRNLPCGVQVTSLATAKLALARLKEAEKRVAAGVIQEQDGEVFARPKSAFQPAFKKKLRFR